MGDIFSKKTQETTNLTENKQVAVQGTGQLTLGSQAQVNGSVNIQSGTAADLDALREVTLAALQSGATAVNGNALVALSSNKVADNVVNQSLGTVTKALDVLQGVQSGANQSVLDSARIAEHVALTATPVSPGAYAESTLGQSSDVTKWIIGAVVLGVVAYIFLKK